VTFFTGSDALGATRAGQFSQSTSKTDILGRKYAPFANPFFDQASTYTPPSVKALFGFCRFYHLTHGIINAIGTKAAEYPVTDVILQHQSKSVVDKWKELMLGDLNYRVHQFEVNLDYFVYGNAFVSPSFPFRKKVICASCNAEHDAINSREHWRYTNHRFWLTCPKCGQSEFAKSKDDYYAKPSEIGLIRWNPENITIFYNEATGRLDYALDMSAQFRSEIMMGRKDLVATSPEIFLQAVKAKRMLVFDKREVFHMRRPSLSSQHRGWGPPLLMPVLKDAFYMQIMKKAQEQVLLTHLLPQVFLYPQPATAGADPFTTVNLADWRSHIQRELGRQRLDPSYYGILPFPLGHQIIGENGRSLLMMQEIRMMGELIAIGMGFPADLVFGQGTYAGTSVSMRMLENFFLSNVQGQYRLLHWYMKRIAAFLNWPLAEGRFKPFKMADDLQRQAFAFQLNQAQKISDTTLLSMADFKVDDESTLQVAEAATRGDAIKKQQLLMAEIQGEAGVVAARFQAKSEEVMMEAQRQAQVAAQESASAAGEGGGPPEQAFAGSQQSGLSGAPTGLPLNQVASGIAQQLAGLPPEMQQQHLAQIKKTQPELGELVQQNIISPAARPAGVDMRPTPEALPPRRQSLS
jgi:hypothetical protein